MFDLAGKRILVTGHQGFLGRHVISLLNSRGACVSEDVKLDYHTGRRGRNFDLTDRTGAMSLFRNCSLEWRIDAVVHLAGWNGGIIWNQLKPFEIFCRNTQMACNVLEACVEHNVRKVVSVLTSCAYPNLEVESYYGHTEVVNKEIMSEDSLHDGPPHPTVACHGYAKRNLELASRFAAQQYGINAVTACLTTMYGPGDTFDRERTKVVGAMVRRFVDAADENVPKVVCRGTGSAIRELLFVKDAAEAVVRTLERYDDTSMTLNMGSGQETSIKDLAGMVADAAGYGGTIEWDGELSDGQVRRKLELSRMKDVLGWEAEVGLKEGIERTVRYYRSMKAGAA